MNAQTILRVFPWAIAPVLACGALLQAASADSIKVVVPNEFEEFEGPGVAGVSDFGPIKQQQLYLATEFASLPATHRTITGFYARPDASETDPSSATYTDLMIRASTTTASSLSSVFANNHGTDVTTVFEGELTISTAAGGPVEGPRDFDYYFPFDTPFTYDPDAGNLLVELISNSGPLGRLVLDTFESTSSLYVFASSAVASTGEVRNGGFVNQFVFVPEPTGIIFAALSVMGLAMCRIRSCG
jgi:hypothetical protein